MKICHYGVDDDGNEDDRTMVVEFGVDEGMMMVHWL